jgi:cobalt-zinc-cadmium efflux system protein
MAENHSHTSEVHSHHDHGQSVDQGNETRVLVALCLTGLFLLVEVVGGILAGSLVLLADAGHMLVDFLALGLAWVGFRVARRPADQKRSFGYHRFSVLAAFVNGVALFFISAGITYEAVARLISPPEVILGDLMLGVAGAGLLINLICYLILTQKSSDNINVKSAALHVLGDLLGSVAAIAAAVIILFTGWTPIDPILSVLVCLLILRSAWVIVARAGHILMQGVPPGLDAEQLRVELRAAVPELSDVHHIHIWMLAESKPIVSLHAKVRESSDFSQVLIQIKQILCERFDLTHSAVQLEGEQQNCPD